MTEHFEIDGITCTRILGTGATGNVYLGQRGQELCAVKVLEDDYSNANYQKLHANMEKEITAL